MRLTELHPKFIALGSDPSVFRTVQSIQEANGLMFLCPKCFQANGGAAGTHSVICWSPEVPQTIGPKPGRWNMIGTGFNNLTLKAGSSSVLLPAPCHAHFFIRNGGIEMI